MYFGEIEVRYLHGGAMFGVVPKPLWEKKIAADARNRIRLAGNVLLLRAAVKNVLVELLGTRSCEIFMELRRATLAGIAREEWTRAGRHRCGDQYAFAL
jgi:hypothetical protein